MYPPAFSTPLLSLLFFSCSVYADGHPWPILTVPLYFDSAGRYAMKISMSNLSTQQNFSFTFTTGSGLVYVGGVGGSLDMAATVPLYNQIASDTAELVASDTQADLLGAAADATIVRENCSMGGDHDSLWTYLNQTVVVVKDPTPNNTLEDALQCQPGVDLSGIIGFGLNRNPASSVSDFVPTFLDSIPGQWISQKPSAVNFTFGMALGNPVIVPQPGSSTRPSNASRAGASAGTIHLLATDPAFYTPDDIQWLDANYTTSSRNIPPSDWSVVLDGWTASGERLNLTSKAELTANLDPIYPGIYVPRDQADRIHASIPGASLQIGLSTLGNLSNAYIIPCDAQFSFGIVAGLETFLVDRPNLVLNLGDNQCVSSIEAWSDTSETQYIFGSRFLCTVYLIFNVPREDRQQVGISRRADGGIAPDNSGSPDLGAIIGGSIGGAALLVIISLGICYFRKHWKKTAPPKSQQRTPESDPLKAATEPSWRLPPLTAESPSVSPLLRSPPSPHVPHAESMKDAYERRPSVTGSLPSYRPSEIFRGQPSPSTITWSTGGEAAISIMHERG